MIDYRSNKILQKQPKGKRVSGSLKKKLWSYARYVLILSGLFLIVFLGSYYAFPMVDGLKKVLHLGVKNVQVIGNAILTREDILKETGINKKSNILSLDLGLIKEKLSNNAFVKSVAVVRSFPHTLKIKIVERKPFAILKEGGLWYMDRDGEPFKKVSIMGKDKLDFPVITGVPRQKGKVTAYRDSVIHQSLNILRQLTAQQIFEADGISEVNFCEIYGFSFYIGKRPVRVIAGFEDIERKISRLKDVLSKLNHNFGGVLLVDLDYKKKAVVRLKGSI